MSRAARCALALWLVACQTAPNAVEKKTSAARPQARDSSAIVISLADLGLADVQRYSTQPSASFWFNARGDRVATSGRLALTFAEQADLKAVRAVEVLINNETVANLGVEVLRKARHQELPLDARLLGDRNTLTFKLLTETESQCGRLPEGAWGALESGVLELSSRPLPLPDDLSLLPMPFIDRAVDREATIPFVLQGAPTRDQIRLASLAASWLGVEDGIPLRFPVSLGELPDSSAVVLVEGEGAAQALGLPKPEGASVRMIDHPRHRGSNVKLLVIEGRDQGELQTAVQGLAGSVAGKLSGKSAAFTNTQPPPHLALYAAPRWQPPRTAVVFEKVAQPESLAHEGLAGGKVAVHFRVPSDLLIWPQEWVLLDLGYSQVGPPGVPPPRLDVTFNGSYLGTLPPLDQARGEGVGRAKLRVHRTLLHGFNELVMHVSYADAEAQCATAPGETFRVAITPDSTLHLEHARLWASLPDLNAFVHDGFPFTRSPDLSQSVAVLSARPAAQEIALVLSVAAHAGSVTGTPGSLAVMTAEQLFAEGASFDKDVLAIGTLETNPVLRRWADRLPLLPGAGGARLQMPVRNSVGLALLAGRRGAQELERARSAVGGAPRVAAAMAFESPLAVGRTVVVVAASSPAELPSLVDLQGDAESRYRLGDLLVLSSGRRWMFDIGEHYGLGELDRLTQLRWFLSEHVLTLVPCLLFGVLLLGGKLKPALERRARARLGESENEQ